MNNNNQITIKFDLIALFYRQINLFWFYENSY